MTLIEGGKTSAQNTGSRCASCGKSVPPAPDGVELLLRRHLEYRLTSKTTCPGDEYGECGECGGLLCYDCEQFGCPCSRKEMLIIGHAAPIAVV